MLSEEALRDPGHRRRLSDDHLVDNFVVHAEYTLEHQEADERYERTLEAEVANVEENLQLVAYEETPEGASEEEVILFPDPSSEQETKYYTRITANGEPGDWRLLEGGIPFEEDHERGRSRLIDPFRPVFEIESEEGALRFTLEDVVGVEGADEDIDRAVQLTERSILRSSEFRNNPRGIGVEGSVPDLDEQLIEQERTVRVEALMDEETQQIQSYMYEIENEEWLFTAEFTFSEWNEVGSIEPPQEAVEAVEQEN